MQGENSTTVEKKLSFRELIKGGLGKTLFAWFLLFAAVPLTVVSVISYQQARESLIESATKALKAVTSVKIDYLRSSFKKIEQETKMEALAKRNSELLIAVDKAYKRSDMSFQEFVQSPEAIKIYDELAGDVTLFVASHEYGNVYLIDTDGTVIYSAPAKGVIGVNLFKGNYTGTLFTAAVRKAIDTGEIIFSDYEKYAPAGNTVVSFIVKSIVNDQGKAIGAIAVQLSIEEINNVIQDRSGIWETEDVYLIGKDLKMRSDSVLMTLKTALEQTVETEQSALWLDHVARGTLPFEEHEAFTYKDYKGVTVVGLHDTVEIGGVSLGIIAEVNETEALAPADRLQNIVIVLLGVTVFLVLLVTPSITRSMVLPVLKLSEGTRLVIRGDLDQRIEVKAKNELGMLAQNFNEMIRDLKESSEERERQNWLKNGQSEINDRMRGDQSIEDLCRNIINFIAEYFKAQVGALYVNENDVLKLRASFAYKTRKNISSEFKFGEGLVGQSAFEKKSIILTNVPEDYIKITSGLGEKTPASIIVTPFIYNDEVMGVIEIGSFEKLTELQMTFLEQAANGIAIAINSANTRLEVRHMLEITRKQSNDLQLQQQELKSTNEDLEEQTRRLKVSEEELKTQQEELQVTNEELLEKTNKLQASEEELKAQQEELQTFNEELEEKTMALEEQKGMLEVKNDELEKIQRDLERKARELSVASKYKSEFLANMSHELRTPLNSLLILAQDLADNRKDNLDEEQIESARIIYSSGHDLLKLINEILDLSKIESGKMALAIEEIDLSDIAGGIESSFKHLAEDNGLELRIIMEDDLPRIKTDRQRLGQIIKNLMSNAIKFTEEGSITVNFLRLSEDVDLSRSGLEKENTVAISIKDTGIGIADDKKLEIFEAFQQIDSGTARKYGGTGLGLSISRELARLLRGEIQLESKEGEGSTFTVFLPLDYYAITEEDLNPPAAALEKMAPLIPKTIKPLSRVSAPSIEDDRDSIEKGDRKILIIEDDLNFAKTLYRISKDRGFKCLHAGDGETGLRLLDEFGTDAIILDIRLPGIQGWDVLEVVKSNPRTRHIPVHIISIEEASAEAGKKGAIGFLTKPVDRDQLKGVFTKIEDLIERSIKNLLIVEDNSVARDHVAKLIGNGDIKTVAVGTGKEALDEVRKNKYDCIILELKLPDISGFQVLKQLSLEGVFIPPVVVYTGKQLTHEEEYKLQEYTSAVIVKGEKSDERLLDETALFLHRVVDDLPDRKRKMIASLYTEDPYLQGKKILLADDDMRSVFAISKVLQDKGVTVLKAADGNKALEILEEEVNIDLVLMDIMMPVMDGYEAMKRIRGQDRFQNLPIIAITAKAMKEDRGKCIAAGANDYIFKPVDINRLLSLMRVWMHRS